jgi:uncharacterized protein (DUF302 family)
MGVTRSSVRNPWRLRVIQVTRYGMRVEIPVGYDQAVEQTIAALKAEGFGVLTTIDVKATMKQKLDKDFRRYVILGACNPPLAHRALEAELEIGLLLPCNVIVYERAPNGSTVAALTPAPLMGMVGNDALIPIGQEAELRLKRALAALESH